MTKIALAVYVVFGFLALAGRGWLQRRRTGNYGYRIGSGRRDVIAQLGWSLVTFGMLAGLIALVTDLRSEHSRLIVAFPARVRLGGLALMLFGSIVALRAQLDMGSSWRVGVDPAEGTELVTRGLFRWVRNPIFAAMLAVWLGLAVAVPNLVAWSAFIAALAGIELQVRKIEEPHLVHMHGERYLSYAARVGRFVPGIGRISTWR